ncbi:MAG: phosphoribosylanthranilate isomerase [Candidatus Bathyarchaeia archaeon]
MRVVKVKICGITNKEDLRMVCNVGADAVGFVVGVPSSPRNLTMEKAEKLVRLVPAFVNSVVVTVPKTLEEVLTIYERLKPNAIQIHGEEALNAKILREKTFGTSLIRAFSIKSKENMDKFAVEETKFFDAVLLDSYLHGKHGGTGIVHNWTLTKKVREILHLKPLILAGGLTPENVKEAIQTVKPYAVDVSTGVESKPGVKDPKKVEAFIKNAKETIIDDN